MKPNPKQNPKLQTPFPNALQAKKQMPALLNVGVSPAGQAHMKGAIGVMRIFSSVEVSGRGESSCPSGTAKSVETSNEG